MNRARPRAWTARGLAVAMAAGALAMATVAETASCAPRANARQTRAQVGTQPAAEVTSQASDEITVVAHNASGVPLHPEPRSQAVSARLADGAVVRVLGERFEGQWLHVRAASGADGWITRRYTRKRAGAARARSPAAKPDPAFVSPEGCRSALQASRGGARIRETARVGSYNLHWFPDGAPGHRDRGAAGPDLEWLACAIASLDVDVLAVQEIKAFPRARELTQRLMTRLDRMTGGRWQAKIDDCPDSAELHVGFFYNSSKVKVDHWQTLDELNPFDSACAKHLRPGLAGYFTFDGGLDIHIVSVHLKSTRAKRSLDLRARSIANLPRALARLQAAAPDADVLVVGDYNTMGCKDCSPPLSPRDELAWVRRMLAGSNPRLRLVPSDSDCTQYSGGRPTRLDLFVATDATDELLPASVVRVRGACVELGCRAAEADRMPRAHARLSDHCPIVLDLIDRDLD